MPAPSGPNKSGTLSSPAARMTAVAGREDGGRDRSAEYGAEGVLQQQAAEPDGNGGDHDHPGEPLVGGFDPAVPQRGGEARRDADPVAPEEQQQTERGGHVQPDD